MRDADGLICLWIWDAAGWRRWFKHPAVRRESHGACNSAPGEVTVVSGPNAEMPPRKAL